MNTDITFLLKGLMIIVLVMGLVACLVALENFFEPWLRQNFLGAVPLADIKTTETKQIDNGPTLT